MGSNDRARKGQFVKIDDWVMNSFSWQQLSAQARALFLEIKKRHNGFNNGKIGLGVREAGPSINVHFKTVGKYFIELQKKGFIVAKHAPTFHTGKGKRSTEWEITDEPVPPDKHSRKLFMEWKSEKNDFPVARCNSHLN